MKNGKVVVLTSTVDPHTDVVIRRLQSMGHQPIRLHPGEIPLSTAFSLQLDSTSSGGVFCSPTQTIAFEEIRSIWWRRPLPSEIPADLSKREAAFVRKEVEHALKGVYATLDCYWMSHPRHIREADIKPAQLRRAAELGFEIPRTLVTTQPDAAMNFYEQCQGRIIFKVFTRPDLTTKIDKNNLLANPNEKHKMVYTTLLTEEQLKKNLPQIRNSPCLFQEYVEKQLELRVIVVGDDIFVAELDSQAHETTRIDWRHSEVRVPIRKGSLPPQVADRCMAFVKSFGLNFSAMDLILTPDGRYVFLESNPNGQWAFVERMAPELKILDAVVSCLLGGNTRNG